MSALLDAVMALISFVVNLVSSVVWLVTNLPSLLGILSSSVAYAPSFLTVFLTLSIAATALFAVFRLL